VVGKNESPVPYCIKAPADELNVLEKRANDTVDEINKVQENIKDLKKVGDERLWYPRNSNNRMTSVYIFQDT
jgi:hypothetical protein